MPDPDTAPVLEDLRNFAMGGIRPPNEGQSLMIVTHDGCFYNECTYCTLYREVPFRLRSVEAIKGDVDAARECADYIHSESERLGYGGEVTEEYVRSVYQRFEAGALPEQVVRVTNWLHFDAGKAVFLQDGDTFIMKPQDLAEVVRYLKAAFPDVERVTSYATSLILKKRTVEQLRMIHEAGIDRVHVGMESGSDPVLELANKGVTAAEQIESGLKVKAADMELSQYIMPGLGGRALSEQNAIETAAALNAMGPDFIKIRTLSFPEGAPLREKMRSGEFERLTDEEALRELRLLIEGINLPRGNLSTLFDTNLIPDLDGDFPQAKGAFTEVIDWYLALPVDRRITYQVGRRMLIVNGLRDIQDAERMGVAEQFRVALEQEHGPENLLPFLQEFGDRKHEERVSFVRAMLGR